MLSGISAVWPPGGSTALCIVYPEVAAFVCFHKSLPNTQTPGLALESLHTGCSCSYGMSLEICGGDKIFDIHSRSLQNPYGACRWRSEVRDQLGLPVKVLCVCEAASDQEEAVPSIEQLRAQSLHLVYVIDRRGRNPKSLLVWVIIPLEEFPIHSRNLLDTTL